VKARILPPTRDSIGIAAQAIHRGEIVGMPTETVYGLAGNAFEPAALARIFSVKERPTFDPLIVHIHRALDNVDRLEGLGLINLEHWTPRVRELVQDLMDKFWPGPLTLVLPKADKVPDLATSGLPTVALRMPRHAMAQALIEAAAVPLAAPSANRFGRISPTRATDVIRELGDRIEYVLDGGACEVGLESTILKVEEDGSLVLLRAGGVTLEAIEKAVGRRPELATASATAATLESARPSGAGPGLAAPGMLASHYAPGKPLHLLPGLARDARELPAAAQGARIGLVIFSGQDEAAARERVLELAGPGAKIVAFRALSASGDLSQCAQNLFAGLRAIDESDATALICEPCPSAVGLGYAITDRLTRASTRK
jgi:L-threonylcarbamoyladenylate synthase